jgi:hypothetical protein
MTTTDNNQLKLLMLQLKGRANATNAEIKELFRLHNLLYPTMTEHGYSCTTCVSRVYKRMQNYYNVLSANEQGTDN